jgi:cytochrome b involved in lipid metabolism
MEENQEDQKDTQETAESTEEETPKKGTNWVTILIVIIIIGALGYFAFNQFGGSTPSPEETQQPPDMTEEIQTPPDTKMQAYTLEEVSMHNSQEDCWIVLSGMVYDVTGFDTTHPGGEAILQGCGTDATGLFEERPTDGSSHSDKARNLLPNFYIGDLTE